MAGPGTRSPRGPLDPHGPRPCGRRAPLGTCRTCGTGTRPGAPVPPFARAGGGRGPPSTGRLATGRAAPAEGALPPHPATRGSMSPGPDPTLDNATGRGPRPHAPPRNGGTLSGFAYRGRTRCRPQGPAMRPHSSNFSNSVGATRIAARQARPSASALRPPKVTGRRASSWRKEWQRSRRCIGCSCPGTSQHQQPSRGLHHSSPPLPEPG